MNRLCIVCGLLIVCLSTKAAEVDVSGAAEKAADFLLKQQSEDGTFGTGKEAKLPGLVALVVRSLANSPRKLRDDNPAVSKAVKYIVSKQQGNGSITLPDLGLENYNTSLAVTALAALENPANKDVLEKAKGYILSIQRNDLEASDESFGGFGYGQGKRGDMSNTVEALEALKALKVEEGSPAWQNAVKFVKRCQDNAETNDLAKKTVSKNSGGFAYTPAESPFGTESDPNSKKYAPRPYGNMTYAAIESLIFAGLKRDDPVLQAAFKWVKDNYSVKEQPGAVHNEGYYYYIMAFAKALSVSGSKEIEIADGKKTEWARDLAEQLISLQRPDGSFVNSSGRWMENNPVLTTAYALEALSLCNQALKK